LTDQSGNGNSGSLVNGTTWGTGKYGRALAFDGVDDYVSIANSSTLNLKGSSLTIEFCRKIDAKVIVRGLRVFSDFEYEFRMALANHHLAPEIEVVRMSENRGYGAAINRIWGEVKSGARIRLQNARMTTDGLPGDIYIKVLVK
jgi:hypothetical protein